MQINGSAYIVDISRSEPVAKENGAGAIKGNTAGGERGSDRVDISSDGRRVEQLKRDLDAIPDVRMDRVALARQTIQEGGYRVEPGVLAQKIMEANWA